MSASNWYSDETGTETVLILGEVKEGSRPPYMIAHFGQEAYENYQIAVYMRELMRVRTTPYLCWAPGLGRDLEASLSDRLPEGGAAVTHAGGLDPSPSGRPEPTFDFGSAGMRGAFEAHRGAAPKLGV